MTRNYKKCELVQCVVSLVNTEGMGRVSTNGLVWVTPLRGTCFQMTGIWT